MMKFMLTGFMFVALSLPAIAGSAAPKNAEVYIINLEDGDTVGKTFTVRFGLKGMGVAPAGIEKKNTGHHHLLIDTQIKGTALEEAIPSDDKHRHFGGGQTEAELTLSPGKHTLQLVLGDHNHVPHNKPVVSDVIAVTVK